MEFKFEEYRQLRQSEVLVLAAKYAHSRGRGLLTWGAERVGESGITIVYGTLTDEGSDG